MLKNKNIITLNMKGRVKMGTKNEEIVKIRLSDLHEYEKKELAILLILETLSPLAQLEIANTIIESSKASKNNLKEFLKKQKRKVKNGN